MSELENLEATAAAAAFPRRPEGSRPGLLGTSSKSPTDR